MKVIKPRFIGNFKLGDNIAYNFKILQILYNAQAQLNNDNDRCLLNKPITIILMSIIEAILHDYFFRINNHSIENSINIPETFLKKIRTKKYDKFDHYIEAIIKYDIKFDTDNQLKNFHAGLKELQKLRNRVHIQNTKKQLEEDDRKAFTKKEECWLKNI
ncbi:MAG: hypothetical protein CMF49_07945 [Legionellales bacterium]|nr:hypothetical protein [Legionellales bacterium]|tara:strand:- start:5577 stop:6056 length:480 start_codon:yes stop_codon:yes gene_type:complete